MLVCILVLATFRFFGLAHLHSLWGCLAFVGFPSGFGLAGWVLAPLVSFCAVLVGFSLGCLVWSGRLSLPSPWVLCPCWAFALGVHRVLSLGWLLLLLLLLWLRPRSALSMWGQFRSEFTQSLGDQGVFCNTAIENAKADKALRAAVDSLDNNRDTTEEF